MSEQTVDVIVVGAGIAGLVAAQALEQRGLNVRLLEARDRVGGRAHSEVLASGGAVDLGPAWIWPSFQPRVRALVERLNLETLEQFEDGGFVYETPQGDVRRIDYPKRYADTVRIRGGLGAIARALAGRLDRVDLRLGLAVRQKGRS